MTIKVYYSRVLRKSWKWKAIASNGRILASGRGFNSKLLAIESVNLLVGKIKSNEFELIAL